MNGKRKLLVGVLVVLLLTAGIFWFLERRAPDCSAVSYDGDGAETNPYEVSNVDQLQCIDEHDLGANYVQVSDIDASETSSWHDGEGFDPIGEDCVAEFNGTFDGNGYEITDLKTGSDIADCVGMFGKVGTESKIKNVSLVNAEATGQFAVGSLIGINQGTIKDSYASGSVVRGYMSGGLIGENKGGTVKRSYASVSVDGSGFFIVGGLVGENSGVVNKSYATGSVSGPKVVGGLVGGNYNGTIRESYATGRIEGNEWVGGLVGKNANGSKIDGSYAAGSVEGDERAGGLIGVSNGTATNSYWDVETTGQSTSAGNATGLTTAQMTGTAARENMWGFDFTNTWRTVQDDYPALRKGAAITRRSR